MWDRPDQEVINLEKVSILRVKEDWDFMDFKRDFKVSFSIKKNLQLSGAFVPGSWKKRF